MEEGAPQAEEGCGAAPVAEASAEGAGSGSEAAEPPAGPYTLELSGRAVTFASTTPTAARTAAAAAAGAASVAASAAREAPGTEAGGGGGCARDGMRAPAPSLAKPLSSRRLEKTPTVVSPVGMIFSAGPRQ